MKIYYVRAEPVAAEGPDAAALVVADDEGQALVLLKKDIDFSGYRMPPAELTPISASHEHVRRVLGATAAHEIGVYGFRLLGPADPADPHIPPAAAASS
jgi:hypothetical protein